jgi:hypothetical protein
MERDLRIDGDLVVGTIALSVPPGTVAAARDKMLDDALRLQLGDLADELRVALAAAPRRYAWPLPGRDEQGRTRFSVCGRVEGDVLVPHREGALRAGER